MLSYLLRRIIRYLILFLILSLALFACVPATPITPTELPATNDQPSTESDSPTQTDATDVSAFPVTIAHKFGSTTLTEKPERIVLVGLTDQDALLALGVVPVATREWWGERPGAIFEWATDELGDAPLPVVLAGDELNFEQIAGLRPDVIVGLYSGLTEDEYTTLSEIAPTIAQPAEYPDWGIPWQDLTRTIGLIVGQSRQAEALIADIEARFAQVREEHPEFADSVGVVAADGYPDSYWAYSSQDPRGQFLVSLGFVPSTELDETIGEAFGVSVSRERFDMLNDLGVLVWFHGDPQPEGDALFEQLPVNLEGRTISIHWDDPMAYAFSFNTVLSLPYVLDNMVPQITAAVDGDPTTAHSSTPDTETASAFPVTIEHKFGSTTITEAPERIVLVGLVEQDALLALGVVPVATREWYGERPGAIFEWAQDKLGDAPVPEVLPSVELNFEQIAALQPDIIVGLYSGLTQEEYDTLTQLAPTVAQPSEYVDYGIPWQEVTLKMGQIVGKAAAAEALIAEVEAKFASMRAEHPEFDGASGAVASTWGFPDNYYAYHSQDPRNRSLTSLGFVIPPEIDELAEDTYGASISRERLDIVNIDVLVWITISADEVEATKNDPLYSQLAVAREGRDIFLTEADTLYDALNFNTVLSLPYVLDHLAPLLAAAVDGDPATTAIPH